MNSKFYKVEILSPLHIGTGDTVDPFHYLIDNQHICHFVDPGAWAADHPDPEELLEKFSGGNIADMRAYLADQVDPAAYAERSCRVVSDKVVTDYQKHLGQPESRNQLLLAPNLVGGSGGPLLPGSSLKGAIRTAVIDWLDREKNLGLKQCRNTKEQGEKLKPYFGDITKNSFQALKIADCEAARDSSLIVEAREVRRNPEKDVTPKASCEVLASLLLGESEHAALTTRIALGRARDQQPVLALKNGETLDWPMLCERVNNYSRVRYQKEQQTFWKLPHFSETQATLSEIEQTILSPPDGTMVLKVGHYSQIEYVTIEKNQPRTRPARGGGTLPYGTTRTLADGIYPFGWVLLRPCREEEYQQLIEERDKRNAELRARQDRLRTVRRAAASEKRAAFRKQLEEQERQKREREERQREEAAKPWLVWVRSLPKIDNWGELKQALEKDDLQSHREEKDLAQAVLDCAVKVRQAWPDKWVPEREAQVNDFLLAAGLQMPASIDQQSTTEDGPEDIATVEKFQEFGDFQQSGISPEQLSSAALAELKRKLEQWGCHKNRVKGNKQAVYQDVKALLNARK